MAKIHILEANTNGGYRAVIHTSVPAGNNSAGKSWKSVALVAGIAGTTILTVGTNPGNITQTEKDSIIAGDTIEFVQTILAESGGATTASITALADQIITDQLALLSIKYKYYGYTQ